MTQAILHVQWWEWITLLTLSVVMIVVDSIANGGHQTPTFKRAIRMVALFVVVGVLYGVFIVLMHGVDAGMNYFAAFGTEYSLSIDNLFIMVVIFDTFKVPEKYRRKLLFMGVFGALVFRFIFILCGSLLLEKFGSIVTPLLALAVGFSVWKVWKEDTEGEIEEGRIYRYAKKLLPLKEGRNFGGKFFIVEKIESVKNGGAKVKVKVWATYLVLCLVVIELMDLLFAFDSVPAALAITSVTYLVYASNAMAILGLRALFFVIGPLKDKMSWLNEGLAVILAWVTVKLLLGWEFTIGNFNHSAIWNPPIWVSPLIIAIVLTIAVIASIYWPKQEDEESNELSIFNAALVIDGGESYRTELQDGLLQRVYNDSLEAIGAYDTDGVVPVVIAREQSYREHDVVVGEGGSVADLLGNDVHGETNLASAMRLALDILPVNEPALVTVISDFQISDRDALVALVDELATSNRQVFLKLVFATSDDDGDYELPQMLDDRHQGIQDKVDAIYATHFHGESGESVQDHFGRELDALARLISRTRKDNNPEPALAN